MNMKIIEKQVQAQINRNKNSDLTDVQMILKNIKTQTKILNQRKEARDIQKEKAEQRKKKAEQHRYISQIQQQEKLLKIQSKQQSRENRILNKRADKLLSKALNSQLGDLDNENNKDKSTIELNDDIPYVQVYSHNHRNYIEQTKNKFYLNNEDLISDNQKRMLNGKGKDIEEDKKHNKNEDEEIEKEDNAIELIEKAKMKEYGIYSNSNSNAVQLDIKKPKKVINFDIQLSDEVIDRKMNELDEMISKSKDDKAAKKQIIK